jgi:hypothetical protein
LQHNDIRPSCTLGPRRLGGGDTPGQGRGEIGAKVVHGPTAKPCKTSADPRISVCLTGRSGSGKFERLPRCALLWWWCVGVRAILENSTACQKSMPSLISVCLGWPSGCFVLAGFFFGWMELSQFDSFCTAGISYPSGFVFPFAFLGAFVLGGVGV